MESVSCKLGIKGSVSIGLLELGVSTEVLSLDENVWHSALSSEGSKGGLDLASVGDLVELNGLESDTLLGQEILGLHAEWAEGLGVDHNLVGTDLSLDLISEGSHPYLCFSLKFKNNYTRH